MLRVSPTVQSFTSTKGYAIRNYSINFGDILRIKPVLEKPIGMDEELHGIRFETDDKYYRWFYPDATARDEDYTRLDTIVNDGNGT